MDLSHSIWEGRGLNYNNKLYIIFYRDGEHVASAHAWSSGHSIAIQKNFSIVEGSPTTQYIRKIIGIVQVMAFGSTSIE
jgi:hypothetical protein